MEMNFILEYFQNFGHAGLLYILVLIAVIPTPVPEDVVTMTSGYLMYKGVLDPALALPFLFAGVFFGDTYIYEMGRFLRDKIFHIPPFKWIFSPKILAKGERLFGKYHLLAIPLGRITFGLRAQVYLHAGINRLKRKNYYLINGLMVVVHSSIMAGIGYLSHNQIDKLISKIASLSDSFGIAVKFLAGAAVLTFFFVLIRKKLKARKLSKAAAVSRKRVKEPLASEVE
jgi:membrane protein DedA with SNARE-associated domain